MIDACDYQDPSSVSLLDVRSGLTLIKTVSRRPDALKRAPLQDFLENRDDSRLPTLLAGQSYLAPAVIHQRNGRQGPIISSMNTSMLVDRSQATNHNSLAALTRAPTHPSSHSLSSSMGARQLQNQRILADDGEALVIPPLLGPPVLECPFNFLSCLLTFSNMGDWIDHSLEHFRNAVGFNVGPPAINKCCFCDEQVHDVPGRSWNWRMHHVSVHHHLGHRLAHARPDFDLFRYLWRKELISDADYRELRGNINDPPVVNDRTIAEQAYPSPPGSPTAGRVRILEGGFQDSHSSSRRRRERR